MIYETVITTVNATGAVHIAPMGITKERGLFVIAPFKPSRTLDNLRESKQAVINMTDDVSIIAGCLTGRRSWPTEQADKVKGQVLQAALSHIEVEVESIDEDELRPSFFCREVYSATHIPFKGFNRAQAAVLEAAILVSRLQMLPVEKIKSEIDYLQIAIDKTSGEKELMAWGWLMECVDAHMQEQQKAVQS
jgi:uncharacterized protein